MLSGLVFDSLVDLRLVRLRPYAFLNDADACEQMLSHLLSLNTIDFYCFSSSYPNVSVTHRVIIETAK